MQDMKIKEELLELAKARHYSRMHQVLSGMNYADIASFLEYIDEEQLLKIFRILPKTMAADVFSFLSIENQQLIIVSLSDTEAANIIDNLMADDATDLLEEMPASIH